MPSEGANQMRDFMANQNEGCLRQPIRHDSEGTDTVAAAVIMASMATVSMVSALCGHHGHSGCHHAKDQIGVFKVGPLETNCYIYVSGNECMIIDPVHRVRELLCS